MRKIEVILENSLDCELSRSVIRCGEDTDDDELDRLISNEVEQFILSVGNTIKIREVVS